MFYKCDNGIPVPMACPEGLNFNTEIDQCDYPENVDCDRSENGGVEPGEPVDPVDPEVSEEDNATGPVISCPADGVYLPDKTDCTVYYVCSFGNAIKQKCPAGLYYDGTIWACTYQDQAICYTYTPNGSGETGPGGVPEGKFVNSSLIGEITIKL